MPFRKADAARAAPEDEHMRTIAAPLASALALSLALGLSLVSAPASAQSAGETSGRANPEFLGIDLDNGSVYYNGRNSGNYCLYRSVQVYNRYTGYPEWRRVRRCGRGLYLR